MIGAHFASPRKETHLPEPSTHAAAIVWSISNGRFLYRVGPKSIPAGIAKDGGGFTLEELVAEMSRMRARDVVVPSDEDRKILAAPMAAIGVTVHM